LTGLGLEERPPNYTTTSDSSRNLGTTPGTCSLTPGLVALATLPAEAGPIDRYPTSKHLVAYFGWCPVDSQSGNYKDPHPRLSQAGNRYVRRILWMLTIHVISRPGPYQDYFRRRTALGKRKMDSVVAVGRKLLTTIYAILKTGRPYDPTWSSHSAHQFTPIP
jgi:transposase